MKTSLGAGDGMTHGRNLFSGQRGMIEISRNVFKVLSTRNSRPAVVTFLLVLRNSRFKVVENGKVSVVEVGNTPKKIRIKLHKKEVKGWTGFQLTHMLKGDDEVAEWVAAPSAKHEFKVVLHGLKNESAKKNGGDSMKIDAAGAAPKGCSPVVVYFTDKDIPPPLADPRMALHTDEKKKAYTKLLRAHRKQKSGIWKYRFYKDKAAVELKHVKETVRSGRKMVKSLRKQILKKDEVQMNGDKPDPNEKWDDVVGTASVDEHGLELKPGHSFDRVCNKKDQMDARFTPGDNSVFNLERFLFARGPPTKSFANVKDVDRANEDILDSLDATKSYMTMRNNLEYILQHESRPLESQIREEISNLKVAIREQREFIASSMDQSFRTNLVPYGTRCFVRVPDRMPYEGNLFFVEEARVDGFDQVTRKTFIKIKYGRKSERLEFLLPDPRVHFNRKAAEVPAVDKTSKRPKTAHVSKETFKTALHRLAVSGVFVKAGTPCFIRQEGPATKVSTHRFSCIEGVVANIKHAAKTIAVRTVPGGEPVVYKFPDGSVFFNRVEATAPKCFIRTLGPLPASSKTYFSCVEGVVVALDDAGEILAVRFEGEILPTIDDAGNILAVPVEKEILPTLVGSDTLQRILAVRFATGLIPARYTVPDRLIFSTRVAAAKRRV
jgi:hypothetical protein